MDQTVFDNLAWRIQVMASAYEVPLLVAIDGRSAAGKSTLAAALAARLNANLFHMDDFFLQAHQRTPERYAESGGNVDRERFLEEVLLPVERGLPFAYRPFDCHRMDFKAPVSVTPRVINLVEGAYSMHPLLREHYHFSVFVTIDKATQSRRILERDGEKFHARAMGEWVPMEEQYIRDCGVESCCDLVIKGE